MPLSNTVYSGRFGCIASVGQVTQWSLTTQLTDNAHSNSYTKGAKMRDEGVKDWNGSCTFLGNTFPGSFNWNQSTQIELYTGGPTYGGTGKKLWGNAIWNSIALSGDISSGNRVQCTVSFQGDGKLNFGEGSHTDTASPNIWMSKDCVITSESNTLDWKSFNFSITNEPQELLDSTCFDDENDDVWKKRYPGIIDCTGTIDWVGDYEPSELNTVGEIDISVKTGNSTVQIFYCKYMRYMGMSNYTVDPSSGALIGGSSSFNMMAHDGSTMGDLKVFGIDLFPPAQASNSNSGGSGT